MPFTTLGQLISEIEEYDEYRPIWIERSEPLSGTTPCYIILGDASDYGDWEAVPKAAKDRGMVRFLSSGQMMDAESSLAFAKEDYTEGELLQVLEQFFNSL